MIWTCRKEEEESIKRVMNMEVEGVRKWGRPRKRWSNTVERDMRDMKVTREEAGDRKGRRSRIRTADPSAVWE